jgi:Pentapeptide repeats (8 copies)
LAKRQNHRQRKKASSAARRKAAAAKAPKQTLVQTGPQNARPRGHDAVSAANKPAQPRSTGPKPHAAPRRLPSGYQKAWPFTTATAALVCIGSTALTLIASVNDFTAFTAVATPAVYAWIGLCVACAIGVGVVNKSHSSGLRVPWYFKAGLLLGVAGGLLSVPNAVHVLRKNTAPPSVQQEGTAPDWRGKRIVQSSFVGKDLRGLQAQRASLRDVDLSQANLSESDLRAAKLIDVQMSGVDLCGADLRDADLRLVTGLSEVRNWAYMFYNRDTRFPHGFHITNYTGPVPDTGRGLLYSCSVGVTRRIRH